MCKANSTATFHDLKKRSNFFTKSFQMVEFLPSDQFLQKKRKISPESQMTVFFDPVPGVEFMTPSFGKQ